MPIRRTYRRKRPVVRARSAARYGMRRSSTGFRRTRTGTSYSRGGTGVVPYMSGPRKQMSFNDLLYGNAGYSGFVPMLLGGVVLNALSEDSSPNTSGGILAQGTGIQTFSGNRFWQRYMIIRGTVQLPPGAGNGQGFMALVYDRSPRGVLPAFGDIFGVSVPIPGMNLQRMDTMSRFSILWRKDFNCESSAISASPGYTVPGGGAGYVVPPDQPQGINTVSINQSINACVSLGSRVTQVAGTLVTDANIANIQQGALYMVLCSNGGTAGAEPFPWTNSTCLFARLVTRICIARC